MSLPLTRSFNFVEGTVILPSQVNQELNNILTELNLLPEKDTTLQADLNADQLDGFHASNTGGTNTIPVCVSGTIQTNLNADMVDGLHASDISAAAFDAGTRLLFYQASAPGGWSIITAPTDHILGWKSGQDGGETAANDGWDIDGITITVEGTELTISQLPSHIHTINHTHVITLYDSGGSQNGALEHIDRATSVTADGSESLVHSGNSGSTGLGQEHVHDASASSDASWRPPTAYIIIAEKD